MSGRRPAEEEYRISGRGSLPSPLTMMPNFAYGDKVETFSDSLPAGYRHGLVEPSKVRAHFASNQHICSTVMSHPQEMQRPTEGFELSMSYNSASTSPSARISVNTEISSFGGANMRPSHFGVPHAPDGSNDLSRSYPGYAQCQEL